MLCKPALCVRAPYNGARGASRHLAAARSPACVLLHLTPPQSWDDVAGSMSSRRRTPCRRCGVDGVPSQDLLTVVPEGAGAGRWTQAPPLASTVHATTSLPRCWSWRSAPAWRSRLLPLDHPIKQAPRSWRRAPTTPRRLATWLTVVGPVAPGMRRAARRAAGSATWLATLTWFDWGLLSLPDAMIDMVAGRSSAAARPASRSRGRRDNEQDGPNKMGHCPKTRQPQPSARGVALRHGGPLTAFTRRRYGASW